MGIGNLGLVHQSAVLGNLTLVGEDEIDLLDVLRAQFVLVLAFGVLAVGIDEQHLAAQRVGLALVAHQHAGRNAGAVEEAGRQADDGLDHVIADQQFADELFLAPRKSTPWGMTVAMWPSGLRLASMCWTNMRSAFLPVSGHHSRKRLVNVMLARL